MTREQMIDARRKAAAERTARHRARNDFEMLPDSRRIDQAVVAAAQQWLAERGIRYREDLYDDATGKVLDPGAVSFLSLVVRELRRLGVDMDHQVSNDRLWHRLRMGPPAERDRGL